MKLLIPIACFSFAFWLYAQVETEAQMKYLTMGSAGFCILVALLILVLGPRQDSLDEIDRQFLVIVFGGTGLLLTFLALFI